MRGDLTTRAGIDLLLRRFYGRALVDDMLAVPFTEVREKGLESHLPVMCDFWETILFGAGTYRGSVFRVHAEAHRRHPFGAEHFDRWLLLWREAVDELYVGPGADRAKQQGERIATAMHRRLAGLPSLAAEAARARAQAVPTRGADAVPTRGADAVPTRGADAVPTRPSDAVQATPGGAVPLTRGHDRLRDRPGDRHGTP